MESSNNDFENYKSKAEKRKLDVKDLEPLLQKCFSSKELRLIEYTSTNLVPIGENFGSTVVKIDAIIKKEKNSKEEKLHLVAKTMVSNNQPLYSWSLILPKEVFVYTHLIPAYKEIEREVGIEEKDIIDIVPAYIGHRYAVDDGSIEIGDSLLLIENMKIKGYFNCDKGVG